jgi:hypothetical protein
MILRKWHGTIRARDKAAYLAYIRRTGMREYRATPGNLAAQMARAICRAAAWKSRP